MKRNNEKELQFGTEDKSEEVVMWTLDIPGYLLNIAEITQN